MTARARRFAPWVALVGVVLLLLGLGSDVVLDRRDLSLGLRGGIVAVRTVGDAAVITGVGLIVGGVLLLAVQATPQLPRGRGAALGGAALGVGLLTALSLGLARWSGDGVHGHARALQAREGGDGGSGMSADASAQGHEAASAPAGSGATVKTASSMLPGVTHANGEAVAITAAELTAAAKLADDVRAQTVRLQDFAVARAEGYIQITGGRNGLAHFHNQAYYTDGRTLDPARPEQLMYYRLPSGEMRLVGVMFLMPPGQAGPRIGGALTAWHAHDNLCYSSTTGIIVALTDAAGKCPPGTAFRGASPEMMHVWLLDNPDGVFSEDMEPAALLKQIAAEPR